jgi:hypothetical protein
LIELKRIRLQAREKVERCQRNMAVNRPRILANLERVREALHKPVEPASGEDDAGAKKPSLESAGGSQKACHHSLT